MSSVEVAQALYLLLAALGLALAVSYAGLPVLSQGAFVAVGGFGTALLGPGGAGLPLLAAVVLAVLAAAAAGLVVALAAGRLPAAPLALATWGLAWLVAEVLRAFPGTYGGEQGLVRPAPATLVSPTLGLTLRLTPAVHVALAATACVLTVAALVRVSRGPGGLDLAALRKSPELAASLGIPVAARRRTVLCVTAALGGLSGAGTLVLLGLVAPQDVGPLLSLQLFVAVLVGGTARWWGPVLGVALLTALPHVVDAFGGGADPARRSGLLTAGLLVAVLAGRQLLRRRTPGGRAVPTAQPVPAARDAGAVHPVLLRATGLTAGYGPLPVLAGVDLELRAGEVHALVGPNGSGKSTLLAVLAGELAPSAGVVEVAGRALRSTGPAHRARAGVVRTPQQTVLPPLSTGRQVALGVRGGSRGGGAVLRDLLATPSARAAARVRRGRVALVLAQTGLAGLADVDPRRLTVGDQRLLQVARAVATAAPVLLLDEPAAGMSGPDRARLGTVLRVLAGNGAAVLLVEHDLGLVDEVSDRVSALEQGRLVSSGTAAERDRLAEVLRGLAGNGAAVLLVEHDMRLVTAVADRVTVLDRGRVLAVGTPERVRDDPAVRRAYLGRKSEQT